MNKLKCTFALALGIAALSLTAADIVNMVVNPKDLPHPAGQMDTLKAGTFWIKEMHGYPHITASGRKDAAHAESNLTRGNVNGWISDKAQEITLTVDFGGTISVRRFEVVPLKKSKIAPVEMIIYGSNDGFVKDNRKIYEYPKDKLEAHWKYVNTGKLPALACSLGAKPNAKEFKFVFRMKTPGRIGLKSVKLLAWPGTKPVAVKKK